MFIGFTLFLFHTLGSPNRLSSKLPIQFSHQILLLLFKRSKFKHIYLFTYLYNSVHLVTHMAFLVWRCDFSMICFINQCLRRAHCTVMRVLATTTLTFWMIFEHAVFWFPPIQATGIFRVSPKHPMGLVDALSIHLVNINLINIFLRTQLKCTLPSLEESWSLFFAVS